MPITWLDVGKNRNPNFSLQLTCEPRYVRTALNSYISFGKNRNSYLNSLSCSPWCQLCIASGFYGLSCNLEGDIPFSMRQVLIGQQGTWCTTNSLAFYFGWHRVLHLDLPQFCKKSSQMLVWQWSKGSGKAELPGLGHEVLDLEHSKKILTPTQLIKA